MTTKELKVMLLQRIANIWKEWEIIETSYSYAKNFLIPKKMARVITDAEEKELANKAKRDEQRRVTNLENKHKIAEELNWKEINFELSWKKEKIFGSITELDVIGKIKKDFGVEFEKGNIILPDWKHIKKIGTHDVKVNLWKDVYIKLSANVSLKG